MVIAQKEIKCLTFFSKKKKKKKKNWGNFFDQGKNRISSLNNGRGMYKIQNLKRMFKKTEKLFSKPKHRRDTRPEV